MSVGSLYHPFVTANESSDLICRYRSSACLAGLIGALILALTVFVAAVYFATRLSFEPTSAVIEVGVILLIAAGLVNVVLQYKNESITLQPETLIHVDRWGRRHEAPLNQIKKFERLNVTRTDQQRSTDMSPAIGVNGFRLTFTNGYRVQVSSSLQNFDALYVAVSLHVQRQRQSSLTDAMNA